MEMGGLGYTRNFSDGTDQMLKKKSKKIQSRRIMPSKIFFLFFYKKPNLKDFWMFKLL